MGPRRALGLGGALGVVCLTAGCSSPRTFAELGADARQVPVPAGVTLQKVTSATSDGPGFTTTHSEGVTRVYASALACDELQARWVAALRRAQRSFHLDAEPRLFGSSGQANIAITDRPEELGVTLGDIATDGHYLECRSPFVWSFNQPH